MRFLTGMFVVAAIGLMAMSAGCGGSGTDSSTTPSSSATAEGGGEEASEGLASASPDKNTYAKQAGVVCHREGQRILAGLESETNEGSPGEFEVPVSQELADSVLIPSVEKELGELRELGAPSGERKRIEAMLAALQQGVEKDKEIEISSLADFGRGLARFDELARLNNLNVCIFGLA